jgi:hypothetical protein
VVLGDWQQVNSQGYIKVKIPTTLPAGSHRIAAQDSRGIVFGWAPITIKGPDVAVASPTVKKAKPRASMSVVEAEQKPATPEEAVAAPAETNSSGDWLLPLAGGFLFIAAVGSAWALRTRRVGIRRK